MPRSKVSLSTPYRWLSEAWALCRANPALFLVAASAMLLIALLPALLQQVAATVLPRTLFVQVGIYVLFSLLLLPPVTGGFYRLAHGAQRGLPMQPRQLFDVLADGPAARRLVLVNLVFFFLMLLGVLMPVAAIGGAPLADWLRAMASLQPGTKVLPPMPEGVGTLFAGALLVGVLLSTARALAMAQASLSAVSPLRAVADGFRVALSNAGAFLLFYVPVAVLALFGFMALALVAVLIGAVLSLVSSALTYLLIMPVVLVVALAYYAMVFNFFYRAWRDTLAEDPTDATPAPPSDSHEIEV
jgi:hypothetical protein